MAGAPENELAFVTPELAYADFKAKLSEFAKAADVKSSMRIAKI